MRGRVWQHTPPKPPPRPHVPDDAREAVDAKAAVVVAELKKKFKPDESTFLNWPEDLFTRWHRDALYFVVVMRTPHGNPPTFETHVGRMEYAGDGRFNLGIPMRRGWNTLLENASPEECLSKMSDSFYF